MYRIARVVRVLAMASLAVTTLMFVPPVRNVLTLGFLPGLWQDASTFQLIKAQVFSYSADTAALSSCTQPAPPSSSFASPLDRLLKTEPYSQVRADPEVVEAQSKARAWINASASRRERYIRYTPHISALEKARLLLTWRVVQEVLTLHNISYFLSDGSLLGAFRHGGMIPWDDDIDLAVDGTDVDKLQKVLSCVPGYTLRMQPSMHWKFFWNDAQVVNVSSSARILHPRVREEKEKREYPMEYHPEKDVVMRYPFIDLFLVTTDGSYLWTLANFNLPSSLYRVEDVYPLAQVNFEGLPAPVPRHSLHLLHRMYQPNMCVSAGHDHRRGQAITDMSVVPCEELADMYTVYTL